MEHITLLNIPIGSVARVQNLLAEGSLRRRLLDIGLTPGSRVTCLFASPAGDPRAYFVRGATIALRSEEAEQVEVICTSE